MDRDKVDMRTEQAWSIKVLLHGKKYSNFLVGTTRVISNRLNKTGREIRRSQ